MPAGSFGLPARPPYTEMHIMTFDELRIQLNGGPIVEKYGKLSCEIPVLPVHLLTTLSSMEVIETGFPGCFAFWVRCSDGDARYTGVRGIGSEKGKTGHGTLELEPFLM